MSTSDTGDCHQAGKYSDQIKQDAPAVSRGTCMMEDLLRLGLVEGLALVF